MVPGYLRNSGAWVSLPCSRGALFNTASSIPTPVGHEGTDGVTILGGLQSTGRIVIKMKENDMCKAHMNCVQIAEQMHLLFS